MPLREHLRELRNRLLRAGLAILVGAVAGWFLYPPVFEALMRPIYELARAWRPPQPVVASLPGPRVQRWWSCGWRNPSAGQQVPGANS